jgi:hypothetical protein
MTIAAAPSSFGSGAVPAYVNTVPKSVQNIQVQLTSTAAIARKGAVIISYPWPIKST